MTDSEHMYLLECKGEPDPFVRRLESLLRQKRFTSRRRMRLLPRVGLVLSAALLLITATAIHTFSPAVQVPSPGSYPTVVPGEPSVVSTESPAAERLDVAGSEERQDAPGVPSTPADPAASSP